MGELQTKRGRLRAVAPKGDADDILNNPTPINETALNIAVQVCEAKLNYLSQLPPEQVCPNELYKIGNCLAGLTRAGVETQRFQLELAGSITLAAELLKSQIRTQLVGQPELVEGLQRNVKTATLKLEEKQ